MTNIRRLGEVCHTTSGGTPSRSRSDFYGGDIPWVKSGDLNDGLVTTAGESLTAAGLAGSSAKIFPSGTLLLAMYGATVGKLGILGIDAATNQAVCGITPSDALDRDFLFYFLLSRRSDLVAKSIGGAQPNISQNIIRDVLVPIPSLDEQRRIVDILNHAASIRRLRDEATAKAREIIPALFVEMFGDPATNPMGWAIHPVRKLLERSIRNGISPSRSGRVPGTVLSLSAITHGSFDPLAVKDSLFADPLAAGDEVDERDFLICRGNGNPDLVGRGVFPNQSMPGVAFPDTAMALRPDRVVMAPAYLAGAWQTAFVRKQIVSTARTTNGTFKVNQEGIGAIQIPLPPIALQQEFAERVAEVEGISALNDKAVIAAEQLAQSLMSQVFGKTA